jgi:hypothetical protein
MSDRPPGCVGWVGRQGTGQSSRSACLGPTYAPADQSPGAGSEENGTPKRHARARSRLPRGLRPRRARAHAGRQKRRVRRGRGRRPAAAAPSVWTWCRFGMLTDASAPRGPSTGGCAQDNVPVLVNPTRVISSNGEDDQKRSNSIDPLTTTTATGTLRSRSPLLQVRYLHGQRRPPYTTPGARKAQCLTGCARTPQLRSWICLASARSTLRSKYASHTTRSACASYLSLASQPHPCLLPTPAPSSPRPLITRWARTVVTGPKRCQARVHVLRRLARDRTS